MKIHQLIESTVDRGRRNLTSRCGETYSTKTNERLPGEVSAWHSQVTCEECRGG